MKKHLSVLMLMARSTIYKILALLVLMAAGESALFCFALSDLAGRGEDDAFSLELVLGQSRIAWVFGACFLLLTALLVMTGCEGKSKCGYTLRRLSVSERWVFLWQSVYNILCYLLLWAVQILTAVALCRLYEAKAAPQFVSGQTVFLAFYRSNFLHSLLPLEDVRVWVCNGLLAAGLGICAARYPMAQRRGGHFTELFLLACAAVILFSRGIGAESISLVLAILAASHTVVALVFALRKEGKYED